jgi:DNA polymerase-1
METILLIDGNAIMHRAYHAIPANFKTGNGISTNMVYGFLGMLFKAVQDFHPHYIAVCFDTPKPTFRKQILEEYQAQRPKSDTEFIIQIPLVLEMLTKAGIAKYAKEGFEADDIIGTLAEKYKDNYKILILTGDKDIMQLVNHNVNVISPQTGLSSITVYNAEAVEKKLGVRPEKIPDLKALMGDPSDNYKGAKGIGPKTAIKLLEQFGSVEKMLQNTDQISPDRIRNLITENKDSVIVSKKLATILRDVEVECSLEEMKFEWFKEDLHDFLKALNINSLRERIFNKEHVKEEKIVEVKEIKKDNDQIDLFS